MSILKSPVFYLVGSNLLFWGLPLLLIQLRGGSVAELPARQSVNAPVAATMLQPVPADPLLATAAAEAPGATPSMVGPAVVPSLNDQVPVEISDEGLSLGAAEEPSVNLLEGLKGAAGLGGPITLKSLKEPLMPIAARAERLQQQRSGDSLAALPKHWRDSLKRELPASMSVSEAAVVRLPVSALKQRQEVPVIVNERGEGEALVEPGDLSVRQAVEGWAARQSAATPGTVNVYVVAAEPLNTPNR